MTLKTKLAILVVPTMLIGFAAHGEGMGKAEVRALLEDVLATEYCGTAIAEGLGVTTAIQGLSPVMSWAAVSSSWKKLTGGLCCWKWQRKNWIVA